MAKKVKVALIAIIFLKIFLKILELRFNSLFRQKNLPIRKINAISGDLILNYFIKPCTSTISTRIGSTNWK